MLDQLAAVDSALFLFFNVTLANPVTDAIMPVITSDNLLRALYGAAMVLLLWRGNNRLRWLVLFSALALALSDQLSSSLLKKWIARPRPCHVLDGINLLVPCGSGFALPSSHAVNAFAQSALFSVHARPARWYLVAFASLISVSRVFVGVHYPGDILSGAVVGCAVGLLVALSFVYFDRRRVAYVNRAAGGAG